MAAAPKALRCSSFPGHITYPVKPEVGEGNWPPRSAPLGHTVVDVGFTFVLHPLAAARVNVFVHQGAMQFSVLACDATAGVDGLPRQGTDECSWTCGGAHHGGKQRRKEN